MLTTLLNAHPVFVGTPTIDGFLDSLLVREDQLSRLRAARAKIRQTITEGFVQWEGFIRSERLFEAGTIQKGQPAPKLPRPKFHQQGSAGYGLLNRPAYPWQQLDFDDGMFLPTSFVAGQANAAGGGPAVASTGYFELVEAILKPLCASRGWKLVQKDCCVRIELEDHRSHVDVALYAIPDEQFVTLMEKAALARAKTRDDLAMDEMPDDIYASLADDRIMLAKRSIGWIESDPRAIEKWFVEAIKTHGEQLRHVCRYLKAWRDYCWEQGCKLSSITLMKCAVDAFDALRGTFDAKRDDAALLMVVSGLAAAFQDPAGVQNPVLDQRLDDNWSPEERSVYVQAADDLHSGLWAAIQVNADRSVAIGQLQSQLGDRVPSNLSLVAPVTAESLVKSYEIRRTPEPRVIRSHSG